MIKKIYHFLLENKITRKTFRFFLIRCIFFKKPNIKYDNYLTELNEKNLISNKIIFIDKYFNNKNLYKNMNKKNYEVIDILKEKNLNEAFNQIAKYKNIVTAEEIFELIPLKNKKYNIICVWHGESIGIKKSAALYYSKYIAPFNKLIIGNVDKNIYKKIFNIRLDDILCLGDVNLENRYKNYKKFNRNNLLAKYNISTKINKIYYIAYSFESKPIYQANIFYDFKKIEKLLNNDEIIIYTIHPSLIKDNRIKNIYNSNKIRYLENIDHAEIFNIINVFITDYSSSISEALMNDIPSLVLVESFYSYDRGFLYKKKDFPFPLLISNNPKKIINKIRELSNKDINNSMKDSIIYKNATNNIIDYLKQLIK